MRLPLLIALVVLAACTGTASAAEPVKKTLSFDVMVGPDDDVPCTVAADLYTPAGTSKANPAPAILATNGFGGSKNDFDDLAPAYARRGYVFLAYSGLGFGGSGCKITLDDPDYDGKAGRQLVDFLAGAKAATDGTKIDYVATEEPGDPLVGMIGGSYGGQIQFAIAGQDSRLDAIVPQITWNDLAYSLTPNNTDFLTGVTYDTPGVVKLDWPVLFTALGFADPVKNQTPDASHLGTCPNFNDAVCTSLVTSGTLGYPTPETIALLRHASVSSYIKNIRIPTFLSQGQSDSLFDLQEAVATWKALRAQNTPVKMLWRSAGHSGGGLGAQESDSTKLEAAYESRQALEWFDFWLKGLGDVPKLNFEFLRDWALPKEGDAIKAVGSTRSYPAGTDQDLFLSSDNTLAPSAAAAKPGSVDFAAVSESSTGSGNGFMNPPVPDAPGTTASFTTAPLAEDFDLVGIPRLTLTLDAPVHAGTQGGDPAGKLVLFAKLLDVAPDGSTTLPRGLSSAVRVADVTKPVSIELPGVVSRFAKGHQLRLVVATSNATNRGNAVSGPVSITLAPNGVDRLSLPRLGRQLGSDGAGPDGTTAFEPPANSPQSQHVALPSRSKKAAKRAKRCVSRRSFVIHVRKAPRGDRIRSVRVTVRGKRQRILRKRDKHGHIRARVNLKGLPKGRVRVVITVHTRKGRVLRRARTYRTCAGVKRR